MVDSEEGVQTIYMGHYKKCDYH